MTKQVKTKTAPAPKVVAQVVTQAQLYKSDAEVSKAILAAQKQGASLQKAYQRIAASALVHLATHGDIRVIRAMIEQFPEGLRVNSMLAYLERFGTVQVLIDPDTEVQTIVHNASKKLNLAGALETQWWKAKKPEVYKPLDLDAMISNVIRLADARMQKGVSKEKGDNIDAKKLAALKTLVKKTA